MWLDNLKKMRKQAGLTNAELSAMSSIPLATINKLFANQTRNPRLSTMKSIVHSMGYTLDDLAPPDEGTPCHKAMELKKCVNEFRRRPEMQMLFKVSENATKEEIEKVVQMIETFKKQSEE